MVWSQEEIDAFKARRANFEGSDKVNDFVNADQNGGHNNPSPRRSVNQRKWKPTSSDTSQRSDDWLGASPTPKKRSWKVKSIKTVIPDTDED